MIERMRVPKEEGVMTWHYRIMQDENGEWGVHEAYCDGDELQPHSWTAEPVFAGGCEDVEAVRREVHRLAGDAYRPPLSKGQWRGESGGFGKTR